MKKGLSFHQGKRVWGGMGGTPQSYFATSRFFFYLVLGLQDGAVGAYSTGNLPKLDQGTLSPRSIVIEYPSLDIAQLAHESALTWLAGGPQQMKFQAYPLRFRIWVSLFLRVTGRKRETIGKPPVWGVP